VAARIFTAIQHESDCIIYLLDYLLTICHNTPPGGRVNNEQRTELR